MQVKDKPLAYAFPAIIDEIITWHGDSPYIQSGNKLDKYDPSSWLSQASPRQQRIFYWPTVLVHQAKWIPPRDLQIVTTSEI
jgi:hypothetical protein